MARAFPYDSTIFGKAFNLEEQLILAFNFFNPEDLMSEKQKEKRLQELEARFLSTKTTYNDSIQFSDSNSKRHIAIFDWLFGKKKKSQKYL